MITYKLNVDNSFANKIVDGVDTGEWHNVHHKNFKIDLTNGAELQDANSNVMTANQISAFLATLP